MEVRNREQFTLLNCSLAYQIVRTSSDTVPALLLTKNSANNPSQNTETGNMTVSECTENISVSASQYQQVKLGVAQIDLQTC